MRDVVDLLVRRADETLDQAYGRFPVSADPETGEWTWSEVGGWTGGFWVGLLRLASVATGDRRYADAAIQSAKQLWPRVHAPTVLRGFLFWYSSALEGRLAVEAAHLMAADFDEIAGVLPPEEEDVTEYDWPRPGACVDSLPGTVPLLVAASRESVAEAHARNLVRLCVRPDGSVAQSATYDHRGALVERRSINGSSPTSTWSRGQAWGMLGLAQAAQRFPDLVPAATPVADWYLHHVPADRVAYWDFDVPPGPDTYRDTSATAIAASALAKLTGDGYRHAAAATVAALADGHMNRYGGLVDGCYNGRKGVAVSDELIWGDYFLLEAALSLTGAVDPATL
jgi:unsaturated chondroitin disaccharide hydrolase